MPTIEVNGKPFETDEEGYLVNLSDWSEDIANHIAKIENVEMSPNHWEVVNFLRKYFDEYQIAPAVRVLTKAIGKQDKFGPEKGNSQYLYGCSRTARQAGVQDRRSAEANRLRMRTRSGRPG